jgi:choline monooxygenase
MDLSDYQYEPVLARAGTIPARWYTDPAFLKAERERVFGRTWQPVGRTADVAVPGSFSAGDITGEPIVIVRDAGNRLRVFSNVCRHRGSALVQGVGHAPVLKCPYHGWTYSLDGRLFGQPEFEGVENWDRSKICLPEFRAETWGPFVFVNQDLRAPSLQQVLETIPQEAAGIGCDLDKLRFSYRRDYVIDCNWKVYIDNYLEGYHLPTAHPGLFRELDYSQYRVEPHRYYSAQIAPIRAHGKDGGPPRRYEFSDDSKGALYYWLFPNFMLNIYPDNLSSNIILPYGNDKTLTIFEWFTYAREGGPPEVAQATIDFSDEIQQEDIRICEAVQRGLNSRYYDKGRFSVKRENGVHHFHGLLYEFLNRE